MSTSVYAHHRTASFDNLDNNLQTAKSITPKNPNFVQLVQITDLHLFEDTQQLYCNINPKTNLDNIMALVECDFADRDLLAITGDLLQEPTEANYTQLFDYFDKFSSPYVAISGNHDVTMELDSHLPFFQRRHLGVQVDSRLKNCHVVTTPVWDIIFLDSSCTGEIWGYFCQWTLDWLKNTLAVRQKPCIIFCHHPMFNVGSAWIDNHQLKNSDDFWQTILPFKAQIKGIFVGHVHQDFSSIINDIPVYTTPSTSAQFLPNQDEYGIDDIEAGLRWITLYNNATLATGVTRVQTKSLF
ncbi:cyclic AMP phosphodiesterase [Moraxella macacae 0408225]|uniref:Cyclic AMP phosphodiesterase n=1 Tax=Moraxella macacae 0408225 TaxID=1230338 RepID=L2FAQ2_9GAMM|nr:metallophosphoesterase [Moraxella macacae]ELA09538.1 cyclic AMP phosphodiesterase [Moraxella macacae 0408225]